LNNNNSNITIIIMFRKLLAIVAFALRATALPATDPNDDDFECYSSFSAWESSSSSFEQPYTTVLVSTSLLLFETLDADVPLTTLCDGREHAVEPYRTYTVTGTSTLESPSPTALYSTYTEASPTCTIAQTACTAIESAYPDSYNYCEIDPPYVPCSSAASGSCFIYAGARRTLFHWDVTTTSGDFCAQNGSTVFASPTHPPEPNTAVVDGQTFTSPTNYISFEYVRAVIHGEERRSRTQCGPPIKTHVLLPITESFSSIAFRATNSYSFNFNDLASYVPVDAWSRQRRCGFDHNQCVGVIGHPKEYTPIIPLPTEILNLEPEEWKAAGCTGSLDDYSITPVALATPAPTVANGAFGRRG
jgi:hypothetical protein